MATSPPQQGPRQKRPKIKGCYECSRRRIDCDREEPSCQKCRLKNIPCSGLGIRYRFNQGVASRGKLTGKILPVLNDAAPQSPIHSKRKASPVAKQAVEQDKQPAFQFDSFPCVARETVRDDGDKEEEDCNGDAFERECPSRIGVGLDHIDGATRFYLQYFSDKISQVTTVINLGFNGYRDLVLPRAETDTLVRKAIVVVAQQHLFLQQGNPELERTETYQSLIRELIVRSNECPPHQDESAITALLLLHLREMINGSDGFKLLYGSLRTVLNLAGHTLDTLSSEFGEFVKIQILRLCLFGETLLDEMNGMEYLKARGRSCLDFLNFGLRFHPELEDLINQLFELLSIACDIYVQRAKLNPPPEETVHLVERFKCVLEDVDIYIDIIGRHLLAWAYFVLAAESSTPDHRAFFLEKLTSLYSKSGCWNMIRAADQIQRIWTIQSSVRWTSMLGGPGQALIM